MGRAPRSARLCSLSQVKSRVTPPGEHEGSARRKPQGPARWGRVAGKVFKSKVGTVAKLASSFDTYCKPAHAHISTYKPDIDCAYSGVRLRSASPLSKNSWFAPQPQSRSGRLPDMCGAKGGVGDAASRVHAVLGGDVQTSAAESYFACMDTAPSPCTSSF
jgi:hypothetical protein